MNTTEIPASEQLHRNEDPITHEPGAHPVSTGVGAVGGVATGAALGAVLGGPIGGAIGAIVGAIAGGLGGSAVGEVIDPTQVNEAWPGEQTDLHQKSEATDESLPEAVPVVQRATLEEESDARGHIVPSGDPIPATSPSGPVHEEIAQRAWSYYEASGKTDGHDQEDWLRAEAELKSEAL